MTNAGLPMSLDTCRLRLLLRAAFGLWILAVLVACQGVGAVNSSDSAMPPVQDSGYQWIDEIGQRTIVDQGTVGLSIAVAIQGKTVFTGVYGHADVEAKRPVQTDTAFDIASVGKMFTAAAILKLSEEGKLSLEQTARDFIPELPGHFPDASIRQLLSHTSGFVDARLDELNPPDRYKRKRYGIELLSDYALQNGEVQYRTGETFVYSNAGFLVLGIIVEQASGKRYDEYVRAHLLEPLGLDGVSVADRVAGPRMSEALRHGEEGIVEVPFIDMTAYSGAGSVCASPSELLTWLQALNAGDVISPESLQLMRTPSAVVGNSDKQKIPYGMAQRIGVLHGHRRVGHTGTFDGGSAVLNFYPDDGLEIAILSNTRGEGVPHARSIETEIASRILGVTPPDFPRMQKPLTEDQKNAISGNYSRGFNASFSEIDELIVTRNEEIIEKGLIHVGEMVFRDPANPLVYQYFLMDGESAGWWVYSVSGAYIEVERRILADASEQRLGSE